jgi:hypothetical protein
MLRGHLRARAEYYLVPLFYMLVVAWIYRGLWHQHGAATGLGWDAIDTHGPDLDFLSNDLAHGRFSLWNPYDKGGYPVFCDPVFDRYYPLNWPFATWGAAFGTGWWLVQLKVLAHHVVAATMLHAFVRSRGMSIRAAMVSAIGLVASTPLLVHKASNILWPIVWVPLVWIAIDWALAKPSARRGVLVGGALLLPLTAGSPPGMVYAALLIVPYGALRLVQCIRARPDWKQLAWTLGAALGIAMLVVAVTVIPTSELVALGSRDRLGTGPGFALNGAIPLPAATRGVFVRGAGPFEIYCGAALALLAVLGVVLRPRADRDAPLALFATAVLGVILAAGATALVLPVLVHHVPPFAMLRVPGRYKLLTAWGLAGGAAYGIAAIERHWDRRRAWITIGAAVVIVILCVVISGQPATVKDHPAWWSIVAIVIPAALIVTRHRYALSALALVVLFDAPLFTFVEPGAPVAAEARQTHDGDPDVLAKLDGVHDRWRIYDEFVLGERAGARLQIRDFRGYPAVDPISLHRYTDVLDFAKRDPKILTDFNVRYVLSRPHFRYGTSAQFPHFPSPGFTAHDGLYEADHPAPLIAWYGAVTVATDRVLEAVRATQEPDGSRLHAVVETTELPAGSPDFHAGFHEGTLESYEPDAIRFSIDAPAAGLVVLNEVMFTGWRVRVDNTDATPITANYLLRGVWVSPGHHEISWTFDPPHWRLLVGGYVLALLVILATIGTIRRARDT